MSTFDAFMRLDGALNGFIRCDEPMAKHTTYRLGGPAKLFIECASLADLALATDVLAEEDVDFFVAGKGSNLLVSDAGYEGAVIVLGSEFAKYDFGIFDQQENNQPGHLQLGEHVTVTAGAGLTLSRLVQRAFGFGLSGLELAVGIPGTLGGALRMNAGTADEWISTVVESVTVYQPQGSLVNMRADSLSWGYRESGIPGDAIIVEATLLLKVSNKEIVQSNMQERLSERKAKQPLDALSCGSVFRNSEGKHAAQLIADCGLSGASCGGALISEKHANFIVNTGSASATDVLKLINTARDRVKEIYGIELRPEVKFLGFSE